MIIHVVEAGDTIELISARYSIPVERLIQENDITNPKDLVVGQTVVIVHPLLTYTVQAGDAIAQIAKKYDVSIMQLLRNNPYLADRNTLYPGETIVISYDSDKIRKIEISGYTYPFINRDTLRKTLPFLTYLTVFNYQYTWEGNIVDIDDGEVIKLAKEYGVAPMMLLSTLSERGVGSFEVATNMLNSVEVQERLIENVIRKLKEKGYYGLNIYLKYMRPENRTLVEEYVKRMSKRLKEEGFRLLLTITPRTYIEGIEMTYENMDYTVIGENADGVLFLSYDWAYSFGPPASGTPINIVREVIENITSVVPHEKVYLGFPLIGYDWQLPYIPGYTMARSITYDVAVELAALANVPIQYDEVSQAPYFLYTNEHGELHLVWFKDARSIDALSDLLPEYDLAGISVWNIMRYYAQMWFIINTKFMIEKIEELNK
ncbi:MAG: Peptidoglycan-binding lysin domain protein [Herbinix sp.]|jgi:spore germination protein|nr:Peptidoglycan-binding lysin domain protein [Herbinix sp.]